MCLGVPGKVIEIYETEGLKMGKIDFGGVVREACLAYVPEIEVGEYTVIHVGFAISKIDEEEAKQVFAYLEENIAHNLRERGEFQLTSCLDRLRQDHGVSGYLVDGKRFDAFLGSGYWLSPELTGERAAFVLVPEAFF